MKRRHVLIASLVVVIAAMTAGIAIAGRGPLGDTDQPITGTALDRASAAALASTGGGRVTETEIGDEDAYYEVEVTLDGGSQVDVHLDKSFTVVSTVVDAESPGDRDDGSE